MSNGDTVNVNAALGDNATMPTGNIIFLENPYQTSFFGSFFGAPVTGGVDVNVNATGSITTTAGAAGSGISIETGVVIVTAGASITVNNAATLAGRSDGINIGTAFSFSSPNQYRTITNNGTITLVAGGGPGLGNDPDNPNPTADGITVGVGALLNTGIITTNGNNSAGMVLRGDGPAVRRFNSEGQITNSGTVTTNGNGSPGLIANGTISKNVYDYVGAQPDVVENTGTITTNGGLFFGVASDAIIFGQGVGDTVTNSGTITINGPSGSGIRIAGGGTDTATNAAGGTIVVNLAAVNPAGAVADPVSGMTNIAGSSGDTFDNAGLIYVGDQTLGEANADPNAGGNILGNRFTNAAPVTALVAPAAGSAALPAGSHGISLLGTEDTLTNSGTIHIHTVNGGSHAINSANGGATIKNTGTIVTQTNAAANGNHGINVTNDTVNNDAGGTIDTYGAASHGINATGAATITNAGIIVTNAAGSLGINATAGGSISNTGTITTNGAAAFGINATGSSNINNSGTITTATAGSHAINSTGAAGTITNTGTITTGNFAATHGINITGTSTAGAAVANSGKTITVNGAGSNAINIANGAGVAGGVSNGSNIIVNGAGTGIFMDGSDTVLNSGTITLATGAGLHGITLNGGGNTLTNSGAIAFTVDNAQDGINSTAGAGDTITNSGAITIGAAGTGSAINAGAGDTVSNTGALNVGAAGSHGIAIAAGAGSVTNRTAGTVTIAAGNANDGINSGGGGNSITNDGTITMNGTGNGIALAGGGDSAANTGTITVTAGAGSGINTTGGETLSNTGTINMNGAATGTAINLAGGGNTLNGTGSINMNNAGSGAHAITMAGGGHTVRSGSITMAGGGDAFNSTTGGNTIVGNGTIQLNGGTAYNLSNAAADTVTNNANISITAANPGTVVNFNGIGHSFTNTGTIATDQVVFGTGIITGAAGGTIVNSGTITDTTGVATGAGNGIHSGGAVVQNSGSIILNGGAPAGIIVNAGTPSVTNTGTITTTANASGGINDLAGTVINHSGTISAGGGGSSGIFLNGALPSILNITGTISAPGAGSFAIQDLAGTGHTINLTAATLSSGSPQVIQLGVGNDTINVAGRVNIAGIIDGGGLSLDADVMNISNMRLGQALIDQLVAAAGGSTGTAQLFGSTLSWNDIETVNVDLSTIISYSSLLTDPRVSGFGAALDSVTTFNDPDIVLLLNTLDTIPAGEQLNETIIHFTGRDTLQAMSAVGVNTATQFTNAFMSRLPSFVNGTSLGGSSFSLMDASLDPLLASTHQYLAYSSPALGFSDTISPGLATMAGATATGRLSYSDFYPEGTPSSRNTAPPSGEVAATSASTTTQIGVDNMENRFITEVIGSGTMANQDATSSRAKSDYFVTNATLRAGYRVTKEATVGAYAGYNGGEAETDAFGSELDYDGAHAGIYGQYQTHGFRATALAGYTYTGYEGSRQIILPGISRIAESDTSSHQVLAAGELAYDFRFGQDRTWSVTPVAGIQYTHIWIDGYSETGAGAFSLTVGEQEADSLQSKVGLELSKLWHLGERSHITFYGNGFWHHEFMDDGRTVNAALNSNAINNFTVQTEDADSDFATVGAGIDAVPFANQDVHLILGYQHQFGQEGFTSHTLYGGYRHDF